MKEMNNHCAEFRHMEVTRDGCNLIAVFLITVVQGIKFSMYNAREEKAFEAKEYTIVGISLLFLLSVITK